MRTIGSLGSGRPRGGQMADTGGGIRPLRRTRSRLWLKTAGALAIAAVAASGLVARSTATQHVQALDPVVCGGVNLLAAKGDGIYLANKDTGETSPLITSAQVPGMSLVNQVGVSTQGPNQTIIFTATINGVSNVVRYSVANNVATMTPAGGGVAGGVNLSNGLYYFGTAGGGAVPGHAIINVLDPATGVVTPNVLDITLPSGYGGNGDLMFDSAGNLYLVSADGSNYFLYRVNGPIPSTGSNQLTGQMISTSEGGPGQGLAGGINGIAFGADGFIYVSGGGNLRQFNPANGALVDTVPLPGATDLGTCADPNRVRLYKNLPGGRFTPTDQFSLRVDGGPTVGNTATTSGTAPGRQDQTPSAYVGPLVALAGTQITITESSAGTTNLANYVTTWTCIDEAQGGRIVASGTGPTGGFVVPDVPGSNVSCEFINIPKGTLTVQKNLPTGRLFAADQFTLSIAPGGAPSATTSGTATGIQAATSTLLLATPGVAYTVSEVGAADTAVANYASTWACVDTANGNKPVASGNGSTGTVTMPTTGGTAPANVVCTFTNSPIISTVKPSKSVSPADGSTVVAGTTVTYTLTFDNTAGASPAATSYVDDLAGVLDDAMITAVPALKSGTGLNVSTITNGKFTIDGFVPAGTSAVVTYEALVKPDADRGDNQLLNFLLKPSTPTPTECAAGDPLCTVNPIPKLVVTKTVDPTDGSTVDIGSTLTYTLTFDNSAGKAPATVAMDDNMTKVLDDATVTAAPTSSDPSLVVSPINAGIFTIRGTVAPGKIVKVTMRVQVNADRTRGDNDLLNFVVEPGKPIPAACLVGDPLCTENPVKPKPAITLDKSIGTVVDKDGSGNNSPGDVVTFAFLVTNSGNVQLTNIVLVDPLLGTAPLTCPQTTLAPGASMKCTGPTLTLTRAHVTATKVTNSATVTGTPPTGPAVSSTDTVDVPVALPPVMPITGSSLPEQVARLAPVLMLGGVGLLVLGGRRRSRLGLRLR